MGVLAVSQAGLNSQGRSKFLRLASLGLQDSLDVRYLVIAGGGGGGSDPGGGWAGGGGAGGYRSSVPGESSGGGASAETPLTLSLAQPYAVTIGAGGSTDSNGNNSIFESITSTGGGFGGQGNANGGTGGSGGGAGSAGLGASGTSSQGFDGQDANGGSGGGGGAGEAGGTNADGVGGDGISSAITGTATFRAGGGSGNITDSIPLSGGAGGGGTGGLSPTSGTANTGGGGGGRRGGGNGGSGGSGVVILSIPEVNIATFSGGVTQTSTTSGGRRIYTITAAGASDTVTFN